MIKSSQVLFSRRTRHPKGNGMGQCVFFLIASFFSVVPGRQGKFDIDICKPSPCCELSP